MGSGFAGLFSTVLGLSVVTYVLVVGSEQIWETESRVWGVLLAFGGILSGCGIPLATVQLSRLARGGRHETVELHRHGLVHQGRRTRCWTWDQITTIRIPMRSGFGNVHVGAGWEFRFTIRFADGARLTIDGLATNCRRLGEYVIRRRPDAVDNSPSLIWRRLPFLIAFFAITFAGLCWYLIANLPRFDRGTPFPAREFTLVLLGLFVSIFGVIFSVYAYTQRPRR